MAVADEIYSPAIVRHSADVSDAEGRDVYKQFILTTREAFPDWTETIEDIVTSGNLVAARVMMRATMTGPLKSPAGLLSPTGRTLETPAAVFYRIGDGRIVEIWSHYDSLPLLKTIGVSP